MKWEIEGELYLKENGYDQFDVVEPCIITNDMDRDRVIYKDLKWDDKNDLEEGLYLSTWLEDTVKMDYARREFTFHEEACNHTISFQPQTKKVRITIEEID